MNLFVTGKELSIPTLFLAPHRDDEMIGFGGWLIRSRGQGTRRAVAFATRADSRRLRESACALQGLGLEPLLELDLPDRLLNWEDRCDARMLEEARRRLRALLEELRPSLLFVSNRSDLHPLHRSVNLLLRPLLRDLPISKRPGVVEYEGLVPLRSANWWLDISLVGGEKFRRLAAYRGQDRRYRLVEAVRHLNAYRGCTSLRRSVAYAEAYRHSTVEEYLR